MSVKPRRIRYHAVRLCMEQTLAADAETRGWAREVERHERTADRIRSLLLDLGEPAEPDRLSGDL
jgi:hypothetical protein